MEVRTKVWIEQDGEVMLSDWRVALLEAVEETGSLAEAAAADWTCPTAPPGRS